MTVNGFVIQTGTTAAGTFTRKAVANSAAISICRPTVGVKAMKTPSATRQVRKR